MSENGRGYIRNSELTVEYIREVFQPLESIGYKECEVRGYVFFIEDSEGGRHGFKSLPATRRYIVKEKLFNFSRLQDS